MHAFKQVSVDHPAARTSLAGRAQPIHIDELNGQTSRQCSGVGGKQRMRAAFAVPFARLNIKGR